MYYNYVTKLLVCMRFAIQHCVKYNLHMLFLYHTPIKNNSNTFIIQLANSLSERERDRERERGKEIEKERG